MAEKMRIPKDEDTGIFEQHAGYFDLPHVDLEHFPADQIPIYKNWAYIKIFRYDMVKQPDVLNLMYFFSQDYTPAREARQLRVLRGADHPRVLAVAVAAFHPGARAGQDG